MDPALDPDPTPDPTPFFSDCKDAKKIFFFHIISYNLPAVTLSSVLKIFNKILCNKFIWQHYFSPINTFKRKGKDPDPDPCL
jgi:hypothetical protein